MEKRKDLEKCSGKMGTGRSSMGATKLHSFFFTDIEVTGKMTFQRGKENTNGQMGTNLLGNLKMDFQVVKESMKPKVGTYLLET